MIPLHRAIQNAITEAIRKPDFEAALPPLSDATWAKLLAGSAGEERERIEFLGDALMYATIGTLLYEQIPQGSPHLYTNLRAVLHSNAVFSRVAEKLDILAVPDMVLKYLSKKDFGEGASAPTFKPYTEVKATADLFETVLGAYYLERGFGALCNWVIGIYRPLIYVAEAAFYKW
ncbi:hypothetical protein DAEQUDRAFT_663461 [Daedalea quercina L-15889]|uniref:RNase III domain-containing protein n=1 Tax=Daedalea quercina L-15889 TaxID=1314783 RepID=A0A165T1S2_9APHY|nr:hypothetical protein DAEQUDRAFT_663461 [Daedalea quercina L-15889]